MKCSLASVSRVSREYSNNKCFQNKHFKSCQKPAISVRGEKKLRKKKCKKSSFSKCKIFAEKMKGSGYKYFEIYNIKTTS